MKTQSTLLKLLSEDRMNDFFALADQESANHDQYLLLKSKWHSLQNQLHTGTLNQDDYNLGMAQVRQGLLQWVKGGRESITQEEAGRPVFKIKFLYIALGLAIGFFVYWSMTTKSTEQKNPNQPTESPASQMPSQTSAPDKPSATVPPTLQKAKLRLPAERFAKFHTSARKVSYEVLDAELEPAGGKSALLHIRVLCKNEDRFGINFWNSSFRLEVGEHTRRMAPTGDLNLVVEPKTDVEGIVTFQVPEDARNFELFIQDFDQEKGVKLFL